MPSQSSPGQRRRRPGSVTSRMATWGLVPALLVALLAGVVGWAVRDEWAGLSALVGGAVAIALFLAGLFGITGVVAGPAAASMAGAFALLFAQILVGFAILWVLSRTDWAQMLPLGLGFLAAGLTFQVGSVAGYAGSRRLAFGEDLDRGAGNRDADNRGDDRGDDDRGGTLR